MSKTVLFSAWRVHTPNLLDEILNSGVGMGILEKPLNIFGKLLFAVGERASQLNDPELNSLMARLTIYECADPSSEYYNKELTEELLKITQQ